MKMKVDVAALENLRKAKGYGKEKFSDALGINPGFYTRVLTGERKPGNKFIAGLMGIATKEEVEEIIQYEE